MSRERHQRKIMTDDPQMKARIANDDAKQYGQRYAERNADPGRYTGVVPQQRRHISSHTHERAVAERYKSKASHNRPGGIDEAPQQNLNQQMNDIGRRKEW